MASSNSFTSRLAQLQEFEKSQNYSNIINSLNSTFDLDANNIIEKWTSNDTLSNDEKNYIDSYSNVQLSYVKYCCFYLNTTVDIQTLIGKLPGRLFQRTQVDTLADAVKFIREQRSTSTEDDFMLIYMMRMIDARSLAYRLCFQNISIRPTALNDELYECLLHRQAKNYLYDIKSSNETNRKTFIDIRHQFFIGCCTFAVALYVENKEMLEPNEKNDKYICLLAKYVRIMLNKNDFIENESIHYCLRGIFALLTNCIPREYWLNIMNNGIDNENDENAQKKNPFNLNLFSLIINKLLASNTLQKKTEQSGLNDETLLLDAVLVFLVNWSDTQRDLDDDEENKTNNNNSSPLEQPNQLLHCLQSHKQFEQTAQIVVPYIDAKYDRLRLMALSILSNIMSQQDFEDLKNRKPNMAKDLVQLLFDFIAQAAKQADLIYKGIPFDTLLHYLLRFLVQDFIKEATLPYISQIVDYAKLQHLYPLKILLKISTNPKLQDNLSKDTYLKNFLDKDANTIYSANATMYRIVQYIRQNLAPPPKISKPLVTDNGNVRQVFISYCHEDKVMCKSLQEKLEETKLFTKIWVDKSYMKDNMIETVAKAMNESKLVFVLLSDSYCQSDFCRMEWSYAIGEKMKIYVAVVQEDFKKSKYDWVRFSIHGDLYFKMYDDEDFQRLIDVVSEFVNQQQRNDISKRDNETKPTSQASQSEGQPTNREYLEKRSIATWTSEDIRNWCIDKKLEKWRHLLADYDGPNLLVLHKDLSKDSYVQYVIKGNSLDGIDVARFKSEVNKLLSRSTTTDESLKSASSSLEMTKHKPPTAKQPKQRRTSKSTNK